MAPNKPAGVNLYKDLIKFVDDRPGHDRRYAIDASKIKSELNWYPEETFETGLKKQLDGTWIIKFGGKEYCLVSMEKELVINNEH